jgi:hypothetical protein
MGCLCLVWARARLGAEAGGARRLISCLDSLLRIFAHRQRGNSRLKHERRGEWRFNSSN